VWNVNLKCSSFDTTWRHSILHNYSGSRCIFNPMFDKLAVNADISYCTILRLWVESIETRRPINILCFVDLDANECKWSPTVCGSQERCVDLVGSFRCQPCSDDDGDGCGTGACQSDPCYHGAICQSSQDGEGFTCLCQPGFTGVRCQYPARPTQRPSTTATCRPGQCLNGGRCEATSDGLTRCLCLPPWLGRYCQVSVYVSLCLPMSFPLSHHCHFNDLYSSKK